MDIIAAHRDGLIEQLDLEVAALAGRSGDYAQRAVVLHHLFDHSRGNHLWALAEARRTLRIASGLARLRRRVNHWGWPGGSRDQAREALDQLSEADRDVLLLRFFERKSACEIAQALNTTEDAAQKRVNRAVERLREFFVKRGVAAGAAGLGVVIASNAVQAAPGGRFRPRLSLAEQHQRLPPSLRLSL